MPAILLSEPNLRAIKLALRDALPKASSAHITEALATGLGFKTHAALLARMRTVRTSLYDVAENDDKSFRARLIELTGTETPSGVLDVTITNAAMPDQSYAEFRLGDYAANDAYYHGCRRAGRPMVMVKVARKYAEVAWDCITVSPDVEGYLFSDDNGSAFVGRMIERFQVLTKGAPGRPEFFGSSFVGSAKRVLLPTARILAEDYFRMLYLPLREPQGPKRSAST